MRNKQGVQLHKSAKRIAALALCCALLLTCLPTAFAAETALGTDSPQVRNLQVTRDSNGIQDVGTYGAVSENDPMYWMGQAAAGDAATLQSQENNRAMVWFGNYKQTGGWSTADKQPLVWRTMTDGTAAAAYPGKVTLMTEYVPNSVRFDDVQGSNSDPLNVWASIGSSSGSSSSLRAWMNGQGGMAPAYPARVIYGPHTDDYYETYYSNANQNGKALNFYDSAFSGWEKNLVVPTDIETEGGSKIPTADKVFALSYADLNLQALFPWGDRSRLAYGTDIACDASKTVTGYAVDSSTGYNPRQAYWWSRSPASSLSVHDVDSSGGVDGLGYVAFGWHGARPALNLDPQSVLFASASKTGGAPAVNANITNASSGSAGPRDFSEQFWRNWDGASYRVFQRSADRTALDISRIARRGNSSTAYLDISWQNGTATGPNNYLGLLAVDTATRKKYVGRVAALNAPSGSVSVKLPIPYRTQGYKVFLWNEYEDGSTRNASVDFKAYNFNEIQDGTPPTISGEGTNPNLHNWAQSKAAVCTVRKTGGDTVSRVWVSTSETDSEQGRVDMALTSGTNQNGKWQSPFVLTANGMYYVWAEDSAGNTAKEPLKVEKIDTTPPAVTVSSNPIGPTNRFVDLTVAASDVESGLAPEAYSFDGGASWQAENKKRYTENQIVQIKVRDAVGNISSVSYTISNILPPLAPGSDNPMYWMGQASEGDAATLAAQENNRAMVWFGRYKQGGGLVDDGQRTCFVARDFGRRRVGGLSGQGHPARRICTEYYSCA